MKSVIILILSVFVISFMSSVSATTYYVNGTTGSNLWDGLAAVWDGTHGPKKTIQAGINASSDNDTVSVADGTYSGIGNRNLDFSGKAIAVISEGGADSCIIDCEDLTRGFYFHSGEGTASVIEGFTITNASADMGSGIYCDSSSSPTITNCVIKNCSATDYGAGICCKNWSSPAITNCEIIGNSAANNGGGICCDAASDPIFTDCTITDNWTEHNVGGGLIFIGNSDPILTGCTISGNSSPMMGGGFYWYNSSPTLTDCTIIGNAGSGGGGIFSYSSNAPITDCRITGNSGGGIEFFHDNATITNCTISENSGGDGAGINCDESNPIITNCTITDNMTTGYGGGIFCDSVSSATITNCIIWGNDDDEIYVDAGGTVTVTYSDVQGGWAGTGNINSNPLLVPMAGGMLRLKHNSPCIDAGTSAAPAPAMDMEGRARWDDPNTPNTGGGPDSFFDIGAYEFKGWYVNGNPTIGNDLYNGVYPEWISRLDGPERTIQAGIDDAADGDIVIVAPWIYTGTGNRDLNFYGKDITLLSSAGANKTIIYPENQGRGFDFYSRETSKAVVMGFTIAQGYSSNTGGGIKCHTDSNPTIINCCIRNCSAEYGGGVGCYRSSPALVNCVIQSNSCNNYGGGIFVQDGGSIIENCLIIGNTASIGGGVSCGNWIANDYPLSSINNCTIADNIALVGGGVCYYYHGGSITNSIIWDNSADTIYVAAGTAPTVIYSDVEGGWPGTGNIGANPWDNPLFITGLYHSFYLSQVSAGQAMNSPCVDAGNGTAANLGFDEMSTRTDLFPDTGIVDMGYHSPYSLRIYRIERSDSSIIIYWNALPSTSYIVQWSNNMILWNNVPVGAADNWKDVDGALVSERYYRVIEE